MHSIDGLSRAPRPPQVEQTGTVSQTHSLHLMQNLLRLSVSQLAYLRNIFPEAAFSERTLEGTLGPSRTHAAPRSLSALSAPQRNAGLRLKTLQKGAVADADRLMDWVDGMFDAIAHKVAARRPPARSHTHASGHACAP